MNVDFVTAIKLYIANYANFKGRSTRAEYWWAMLFIFILSCVVSIFNSGILNSLLSLAVLIPNFAIMTRRFHDTGRSGRLVAGIFIVSLIGIVIAGVSIGPAIFSAAADPLAMTAAITDNIGMVSLGYIIALAAGIYALIICIKPSALDNQYGPNPYGAE